MNGIPRCPTCRQPWRDRLAKRCPVCREDKPLSEFNANDGYCRPCRRAYMRRYLRSYRKTYR